MYDSRPTLRALAIGVLLAFLAAQGWAQSYPTRALRIVVPQPRDGGKT
jgi:hypothetical protein